MLRGLTTISFYADDIAAARDWYTEVLGVEAYFTRPGYVEFRVGEHQHELGIIDARYAPAGRPETPGGAVVYWHVDDVHEAYARLLALGATEYDKPVERGPGFVTASVVDPFGNVLGVMFNQHYIDMSG